MDLENDLPMYLVIELEGVRPFWVDVQYRNLPIQCALCK